MDNNALLDEVAAMKAAMEEPIKYATFSGGGAKGAIYSGVHEALYDSGVLAGLDAVAGVLSHLLRMSLKSVIRR